MLLQTRSLYQGQPYYPYYAMPGIHRSNNIFPQLTLLSMIYIIQSKEQGFHLPFKLNLRIIIIINQIY